MVNELTYGHGERIDIRLICPICGSEEVSHDDDSAMCCVNGHLYEDDNGDYYIRPKNADDSTNDVMNCYDDHGSVFLKDGTIVSWRKYLNLQRRGL